MAPEDKKKKNETKERKKSVSSDVLHHMHTWQQQGDGTSKASKSSCEYLAETVRNDQTESRCVHLCTEAVFERRISSSLVLSTLKKILF